MDVEDFVKFAASVIINAIVFFSLGYLALNYTFEKQKLEQNTNNCKCAPCECQTH